MVQKYLISGLIVAFFMQNAQGQITPYQSSKPIVIQNNVGIYPKQRKAAPWDGRQPGTYSISFKIKGLKTNDTVFLADYHLDSKYLRDTAVVDKKGVATFTGNKALQRGFYLFVLPHTSDYFEFIMDDDQEFSISTDTAYYKRDYYTKMKVEGSEQNAAYVTYQLEKSSVIQKIFEIDEKIKEETEKVNIDALKNQRATLFDKKNNHDLDYIKKYPGHLLSRFLYSMIDVEIPEELKKITDTTDTRPYKWYKTHYWDHVDFNEDGLIRLPVNVLKQKLDVYFDKMLAPDADSLIVECNKLMELSKNSVGTNMYVVWYLTNRFESSNIMGLDKVFVHMAKNTYCAGKAWWADSALISRMCENADRRAGSLVGVVAPPLELQNQDSVWINTANINGPYTIMIFWDPTCGHCKEVMPKLLEIYKRNKDKGWKVIALASGDKKKEWKDYLAKNPEMNAFTNLIRGEVRGQKYADNLYQYYVIASPTIFLLNDKKVIEANRIDVDKIEEFTAHLDKIRAKKGNQ